MATRRKPDEYNWKALEFDARPLPNLSSRSSARRDKIKFVVVHHMTIVGDGDGDALDACIATWKNREASAHYGVDGELVAQFVWDNRAAWATATTYGNHAGISIEHANSKRSPSWEVANDTWHTGAKLVAYLCLKYDLGRPKAGKNLFQHSDFFATACAGPYLGDKVWDEYEDEAQRVYDAIVKGEEPGEPDCTPKPPKPAPSTDKMDPKAYFIGARGEHVTWLGKRLVIHGFGKHYEVGPGPTFSEADRLNVQDFQEAQGWSGADADGFPGEQSLKLLAAAPEVEVPPASKTVTVKSAILNTAGANAHGKKTATSRMKAYAKARGSVPVHVINVQEASVASGVRPALDKYLKPFGYKRAGGGKARYCYTRGVKVIDAGLFTVPSKWWFLKNDKQAAWVVYEIGGARGMDVSMHLEYRPGATADNLRVKQAQYIATSALAKAKALKVPEQNIMLTGDTNSEAMVVRELGKDGWRNVAEGSKFEHTYTFMGWDGRSRKRFDYALVRDDAAKASIEAISHDNDLSDHASIRVRRELIK